MRRDLLWCAVPILSFAFVLALPDISGAGSMRSAGARSSGTSAVYVYVPVQARVGVAADEDYAYGSLDETVVMFRLRVPANAQVWFDGSPTAQTGSVRPFITEGLEPGKDYSYEIRARWTENGRPVEQTRKITFRCGDRLTLSLTPSR